ncbi:hypothetical protein [Granulosicoccus antarcticus]|uniref:OmpA-like domain-containing protein n=1 Tax=Granulosicoccus antarcticus IMCC3135 TaxID=1192854 RepID=A0A2Z2NS76_9GAMM|nr:hypothetical protein [Granulosicoccus antarcticus]ASJ74396.1 hypothetical protein IMCC3135_21595 [Granulosicoccus antarcticus IMCC3135]
MHLSRFTLVFLLACLPLGCVSQPPQAEDELSIAASGQQGAEPVQIIAGNFVNTLRQIDLLQPAETTINLLRTSRTDEFTVAMQMALRAAGYGVRWVNDTSSGQLFQYRLEQKSAQKTDQGAAQQATYEMAIGSVELRRSFLMAGVAGISPLTPLYVRGADASAIIPNDRVFANTASVVDPVPVVSPNTEVATGELAQDTAGTNPEVSPLSVPDEANPLNPVVSGAIAKQNLALPLANLTRVENVFDLGESNFEDLLAEHRVVEELILLFPNDSLRLGAVNKRLVDEMVLSFEPESDLFSVIGCSLGPTELESGNAALALGRASRVREALLFAGIPQNRILDEGCWAGDSSGNTLPRRGVVVTLNRQD